MLIEIYNYYGDLNNNIFIVKFRNYLMYKLWMTKLNWFRPHQWSEGISTFYKTVFRCSWYKLFSNISYPPPPIPKWIS